jgi:hypothetical protein
MLCTYKSLAPYSILFREKAINTQIKIDKFSLFQFQTRFRIFWAQWVTSPTTATTLAL